MQCIRILAINPGSTSTKFAVVEGTKPILIKTIRHSPEELAPFEKITDQFNFRKNLIVSELQQSEIALDTIRIVMGRGGLLKPIPSGVFAVNERMKEDLIHSPLGEHASNLGGLIADDLARSLPDAKAYIADPVVVDEFEPLARVSGHPLFKRVSIFHTLNQKAVARRHAKSLQSRYEDLNLIVVHLGGGISIGVHQKGKVIDVNQALDGEGPFSPERSGTLPAGDLVNVCFSGNYTQKQVKKMIKGEGGMVAFLGTNDAYEVEQRMERGDREAEFIFEAMAYQVAKNIGAMATVMKGKVDGILLTGGVANSQWFVNKVIDRVHWIAPSYVYPGEDEMSALAMNGLMVLNGEAEVMEYT